MMQQMITLWRTQNHTNREQSFVTLSAPVTRAEVTGRPNDMPPLDIGWLRRPPQMAWLGIRSNRVIAVADELDLLTQKLFVDDRYHQTRLQVWWWLFAIIFPSVHKPEQKTGTDYLICRVALIHLIEFCWLVQSGRAPVTQHSFRFENCFSDEYSKHFCAIASENSSQLRFGHLSRIQNSTKLNWLNNCCNCRDTTCNFWVTVVGSRLNWIDHYYYYAIWWWSHPTTTSRKTHTHTHRLLWFFHSVALAIFNASNYNFSGNPFYPIYRASVATNIHSRLAGKSEKCLMAVKNTPFAGGGGGGGAIWSGPSTKLVVDVCIWC